MVKVTTLTSGDSKIVIVTQKIFTHLCSFQNDTDLQ